MLRHPNENNYMISPMKSPEEMEESHHSEAKKSRNRHLAIINQLRKKEDTWDTRFYLENIPEYNFGEDKHCETYKKILIKKKNRKFVLKKEVKGQPTQDIGVYKRKLIQDPSLETNFKRPESHEGPTVDIKLRGIYGNDLKSREKNRGESMRRHNPILEGLLKEKKIQEDRLIAAWEKYNIPMFHQEAFFKCENMQNIKQSIEIIKNEADELQTNSSPIQFALRAVVARENCLKQLRNLIQKLELANNNSEDNEKESLNIEELKQKSSELLTHLRILSLNAVETILKWREYIQQTYYITRGVVKANQTILIPFLHNEENYLIKIKNDTKDFTGTPLSEFFTFSSKSDPFLVYPAKENNRPGKLVLYISRSLINRIRACELVLLEESVHEHMTEKSSASTAFTQMKSLESPSERSLHHRQEDHNTHQKKTSNIKIRNTSLVTSAKTKKAITAQEEIKNRENSASQPERKKEALDVRFEPSKPREQYNKKEQSKSEHHSQQTIPREQIERPVERHDQKKVVGSPKRETGSPKKNLSAKNENKVHEGSDYVKPIDLYEDEMEGYLKNYVNQIDQEMRCSFINDPKVLIERANMGQDPVWFDLIEGGEKKVGIAVAHIDNTVFTCRRMVILHFTLVNRELYQEYLGKFVEYLWKNDECDEIKISLYYLEDQDSHLGADKQLQDCIKKLGFKWKQLTNDKDTGKRYIDYVMKRPENVVALVNNAIDEPIHVKSVVVLSDLQGETTVKKHSQYMFDNRFAVLSAVLKHCDEKIDKLCGTGTKKNNNYLQVIGSLLKEGTTKIGDLTGKFQNLQEMEAYISEKFPEKAELLPQIDAKYSTNIFTTSLLNLIYRWKSFNVTHHQVNGKDCKYLKINNNGDLVQFQSKHKSSSIYFIPTDDNEVNVFLTDNDAIINEIINKEEIMEDTVSKLFSKLEKTPTTFQEDLWVPLFSVKDKNVDLEDAKSILQGEYKINYAMNTCQIGLNGSRVPGNLKVRPTQKSKVIEKPFLFGIVHEQVDFPLFAVVIKPEDFLQFNV